MGPYVDAVSGDLNLPSRADVVIIGGGIIGVSAALELARRGLKVTLCEKGYIACEQSSRNWGWCRQAGRDEREMPLITESMRLWRDMDRFIGSPVGYVESGTIYVGGGEKDRAVFESWVDMAKPYETQARLICGVEFERRTKLPPEGRFGLFVPTDGRAEPQQAAPAIAKAAQAAGATILSNCAVRSVDRSAGSASGVVTERGRIDCDAVIIAAGAWSTLLCDGLEFSLPQLRIAGTVLRTSRVDGGPESSTWIGRLGFRKRQDGGYTIADGSSYSAPIVPDSFRFLRQFWPMLRQEWRSVKPLIGRESMRTFLSSRPAAERQSVFEQVRVLEPEPDMVSARGALEAMARFYPAFRSASIVQAWAGFIDVTPDAIPYLGALPCVPGITVATGFSGHGFGIGPAAGRLAARIACGDAAEPEQPPAMRLARFDDGSPVELGAEV